MKRLSCILLAAMLVAALAVSCTAEVIDDMNLVSVGFEGVRDDGSKGLTVAQATLDVYDSSIFWTYKAYKNADDKTPATGTKTEETDLKDGISASKLTLSQGVWNFELYGYVGDVLVYQGKAKEQPINGTKTTVQIKVSPLKTEEGKGTLVFRKGIVIVDGEGKSFAANSAEYAAVDGGAVTPVDLNSDQDTKVEDLKSGAYTVTVYCKDAGFVYAQASAVVTIYDGLESFISGTLDENTAEAGFGVIKVDAAAGTTSQSQSISDSAEAEYIYGFSPASEGLSDTKTTTIKGSFGKTDEEKASSLELKVYDRSSSAQRFTLSNEGAVIAGFDFTLDNATIVEGKPVTVSAYIGEGYNKEELKVVYNGTDGTQPTVTGYENGVITFTTTHFSEYYVTTSDACVLNVSSNKKYIDLQDAIDNANDFDEIKLLKNIVRDNVVIINKSLVLNIPDGVGLSTGEIFRKLPEKERYSFIQVVDNSCLTLVGKGSVYTGEDVAYGFNLINGSLEIAEKTIINCGVISCVQIQIGELLIKEGVYSLSGASTNYGTTYLINCLDANYNNETAKVSISGGKFEKFNPADCAAEGAHTNFVAKGYEVVEESGVYTVRPKAVSVWTGNVYEYETTYEEGSSKGFVVLTNSDLDSSAALAKEGVLENAKKFVSWFSGEFLDTKKLTIIEEKIIDNEAPLGGKSHAQVTVSSADGLIVLPLIKDYFYALSLIECDKTGNKGGGVNAYYYMAKGFDVVVDKDIDFANKNRIPMQKGIGASIDFKGHTVKNIKSVSDEEGILLGLFGNVNSVSNLVIENAYVEGTGNGSSVGALMGYSDNGKLENVTIKDSLIKGSKYTGGIAGRSYSDITNCKVENCDISTTSKEVGGLVGLYCNGTLSSSTVARCTITAKETEAGGLVGRVFEEASPSVVGNTVEGTAVKISGEVAKADIGSAENYLGLICGRVLDSSANDKTQPETIIKDNIVK